VCVGEKARRPAPLLRFAPLRSLPTISVLDGAGWKEGGHSGGLLRGDQSERESGERTSTDPRGGLAVVAMIGKVPKDDTRRKEKTTTLGENLEKAHSQARMWRPDEVALQVEQGGGGKSSGLVSLAR